jgi:hypothetical protein
MMGKIQKQHLLQFASKKKFSVFVIFYFVIVVVLDKIIGQQNPKLIDFLMLIFALLAIPVVTFPLFDILYGDRNQKKYFLAQLFFAILMYILIGLFIAKKFVNLFA